MLMGDEVTALEGGSGFRYIQELDRLNQWEGRRSQ